MRILETFRLLCLQLTLLYIFPAATRGKYDVTSLKEFDQSEFYEGLNGTHLMAPTGYVYVPKACEGGQILAQKCLIHIYLHGCLSGTYVVQGVRYLTDDFPSAINLL